MYEIEPIDSGELDSSVEDDQSEASEEEEECRVCRGPAEEGRPLYAPCRCSGSIGLTHQDCLTSWLSVTRGNGQCELCGLKFQFAPRYKEGTPDYLPNYEVFLGLCNRAAEKWLPLMMRIITAIVLWLGMVPLTTAYLYHGWMHRPSSILARFKWELVPGDLVSGAVIASFIIVTFLSFMSFADFLRFNWQGGIVDGGQGLNGVNRGRQQEEKNRGDWDMAVVQLEIINRMKEYISRAASDHEDGSSLDDAEERRQELYQMRELVRDMEKLIHPLPNEVPRTQAREQELQRHDQTRELLQMLEDFEADNEEKRAKAAKQALTNRTLQNSIADVLRAAAAEVEDVDDGDDDDEMLLPNNDVIDAQVERAEVAAQPPPPAFDGFNRIDPPQPRPNPEDEVDMDINLALDELLGLRGPFNILIRNVCWLLAFNTTYLGLFAFIPKNFGASMHSLVLNRTSFASWMYNSTDPGDDEEVPFPRLISALNEESSRLDTTLRLPDLAIITLGYLTMALMVVLVQLAVYLHSKFSESPPAERVEANGHARGQRDHAPAGLRMREPAARMANNQAAVPDGPDDREMDDMIGGLGEQLTVALDFLKAMTKVGFLLFHKMLLLPLVLGIWLDSATLTLFGSSRLERAVYAGSDLFSSALLHWVAGITFMLFVTVSVLQLREVAHPGILARIIRPQEPQPDLLSNLLHESLVTHAKRMLMSFVIYAALLSLYVVLPARILVASGIGQNVPFSQLHFSHLLMPQLQIPLELMVFHLTMLALLEKYKNRIGEMQHHWLVFTCELMGLTEYVLPRYIEKFELLGSRHIFLRHLNVESDSDAEDEFDDPEELAARRKRKALVLDIGRVDPFWYELVANQDNLDGFFSFNLDMLKEPHSYRVGTVRQNGERIPCAMQEVIVLPPNWTKQVCPMRMEGDPPAVSFLPTCIGPYRLCRRLNGEKAMIVDFYKEVPGMPVPRPPEGWDDLGIGGAEVQGRWAWGKEKKSTIEYGIAHRTPIFQKGKSWKSSFAVILKGVVVVILTWFVISIVGCLAVAFPLWAGRTVYSLLRVPDRYVHDPFAFAIGMCFWRPAIALLSVLWKGGQSILGRILEWTTSFRFPTLRKGLVVVMTLVLWLVAAPLSLGVLYDLLLLKGLTFFSGEDVVYDSEALLTSWATGTMLLNMWAWLCYCSVFTWDFWANIFVVDAPLDAEAEDRDIRHVHQAGGLAAAAMVAEDTPDDPDESTWQGEEGKIGRFISTLSSTLLRWEWERVDHEVLLKDCSFTVARHVTTSLLAPSVAFLTWLFALSLVNQQDANVVVPVFGKVENALYRAFVFRTFAAVTLLAQLAAANRTGMRRWFQAAHRAARDGRYLEGEILLNYVTEDEDGD